MADELSTQVLRDGQLAVATTEISGTMVSAPSDKDTTALIETESGKQLAVKTFQLGSGASTTFVNTLPETGEEGKLYLVNTGTTRDGYAIFQMFSWHENEWISVGAYDVGITPTGLVYEQSWDASTGTWVVTINQ